MPEVAGTGDFGLHTLLKRLPPAATPVRVTHESGSLAGCVYRQLVHLLRCTLA